MSGRIHLLDAATISQIAAGEVVERPASVLKELIENALDAQASYITIEIEDGGTSLIRITDDGAGFAREDIPLAFQRHATSKLQQIRDLESIASYGFRGEALYSIAAVSKTELITKRREDTIGSRISVEGGVIGTLQDAGCPNGSTLIIRELFYNVPARRKFLKSSSAETAQITTVVSRMILANTQVAFRLIQHGKYIFNSPGDGDLSHAILAVFGKETGENLFPIEERSGDIVIKGCMGKPLIARSNRSQEILFINGRWIQNSRIEWAIEQAYSTSLIQHRFPFCVLSITMPQNQIDVNVHPNKTQVRFMQENDTVQTVLRMLRGAVSRMMGAPAAYYVPETKPVSAVKVQPVSIHTVPYVSTPVGPIRQPETRRDSTTPAYRDEKSTPVIESSTFSSYRASVLDKERIRPYNYRDALPSAEKNAAPLTLHQDLPEKKAAEQLSFSEVLPSEEELHIIGVLFSTYVLLQANDALYIIDQHAAHERLLYDRYCASVENGVIVSQQLLIPQIIEVTYEEKMIIEEKKEALQQSGFALEKYGRLSYKISAIPQIFGQMQSQNVMLHIIRMLQEESKKADTDILAKIAQTACKHAVKAGDTLSEGQIRTLLHSIKDENIPMSCPHGRPICIQLTKMQVEKMFMRIQP